MAESASTSEELQTIEERRQQRKRYRELREELNENADRLGDVDSNEFFEAKHTHINSLFASVDNVRELGIDADTLNELSKGVKSQASKLSDMSASFSFRNFVDAIQSKYADQGVMSWARLGQDCGGLFSAAPMFNIMLGSLQRELKVRKQTERKARDTSQSQSQAPEDVIQQQGTGDAAEEATNQRCQKLFSIMNSLSEQEGHVDLLELLVDPQDCVQTVENLFDFSFLIKDKRASLQFDENQGEMTGKIENPMNWKDDTQKRQMVMALSMKDLKELGKVIEEARNNGNNGSESSSSPAAARSPKRRKSLLHRDDAVYRK